MFGNWPNENGAVPLLRVEWCAPPGEDGFDGVFALSVSALVPTLPKPGAHGLHQGAAFFAAIRFPGAAGCDVTAHRAVNQTLKVCP